MNPTPGDVYVSPVLSAISNNYIQDQTNFAVNTIFPMVPVDTQAAQYFTFDRGDWLRVVAAERAPATESRGGGFKVTPADVYYARVYAVHKDLDDQTLRAAASQIQLDTASTEWVTQQLLLLRETKWASSFFTTGVWGKDKTGVSSSPTGTQFLQWNDAASNPISDIQNEVLTMAEATGFKPNVLVLSPHVYLSLREHPDITDRIKYTSPGLATNALLAELFEVEKIVVPYGIVNSANQGAADAIGFIVGKGALLAYAAPNPSLVIPSAGYTFNWTGYLGAGAAGNRVKRFRMEEIASDRIEGEMAFDMKATSPSLGVFFSAAVA